MRLIASYCGLLHLIAADCGRLIARAGLRLVADGRWARRVLGHGSVGYVAGLGVRGFLARRPRGGVALGRAGRRGDPLTLLRLIAAYCGLRIGPAQRRLRRRREGFEGGGRAGLRSERGNRQCTDPRSCRSACSLFASQVTERGSGRSAAGPCGGCAAAGEVADDGTAISRNKPQ